MWAVEIQTIPASAEDSEAPLRATGVPSVWHSFKIASWGQCKYESEGAVTEGP